MQRCGQLLNSGKPPNGVERRVERGDIFVPLDTRLTNIEHSLERNRLLMIVVLVLQVLLGGYDGIAHLGDVLRIIGLVH